MKKLFQVFLVVCLVSVFSSCSSDDYEPQPPVITYPDNGTPSSVAMGGTVNFTFNVSASRGYNGHLLTWSAGSVIENQVAIPIGEKTFSVSGQFTAGNIPGPGGISLTVTDRDGATALSTIAIVVQ